jgi:hypothetical protein
MAGNQGFQYDVFRRHSGKNKVVVRPLAERLRQDGLIPKANGRRKKEELHFHPSAFSLDPAEPGAPVHSPACRAFRSSILATGVFTS